MGDGRTGDNSGERPARFADALRHRAFLVLYAVEIQSIVGSQIARVALSVLVFERTGSAAATALTYAATFLPAILGGLFLASLGDRLPRRPLMIGCDVVRAGLFAAMAIPGVPIAGLVVLLVAAVFVSPVFTATQLSYLGGVLAPEVFRAAAGLRILTSQASQVVGFAVGGVLVQALGARGGLLLNAITFGVSAVAIAATLRGAAFAERGTAPAPEAKRPAPSSAGLRRLLREHRLWLPIGLGALAGLYVVPEGLAVPFAAGVGASEAQTGLLMASIPMGSALGVVLLVRLVPKARRRAVAGWMAIGCGAPLVLTAFVPHWPAAVASWFVSGFLAAYQVEVMTSVVQSTPGTERARIVGFANSVLVGAQGIGLIAFGQVSTVVDAGDAIGLAGGLGSVLAVIVVLMGRRADARSASGGSGIERRLADVLASPGSAGTQAGQGMTG